ncbi:MAG: serine hydrolase, partial [bacterium]
MPAASASPVEYSLGKGRFIHYPGPVDRAAWEATSSSEVRGLAAAIRDRLPSQGLLRLSTPETTSQTLPLMRVTAYDQGSRLVLHLVNYSSPQIDFRGVPQPSTFGTKRFIASFNALNSLEMNLHCEDEIIGARLYSWDGVSSQSVEVMRTDGGYRLTVPRLQSYAVLVLETGKRATFVEQAVPRGLFDIGSTQGVVWGDFDGDGDEDLVLCVDANGAARLLENDGTGHFSEVQGAFPAGEIVESNSAVWFDFDRDEDLDIFFGAVSSSSEFFRNDGGGNFTNVSSLLSSNDSDFDNVFAIAAGDFDKNGYPDLFHAAFSTTTGYNRLWANQGLIDGLDLLMEKAIRDGVIPGGVVAVGTSKGVLLEKAYGNSIVTPEVHPATVDTLYDLASLTKVVATSSAVMKLVEEGLISLDDPISKYLPQWDQYGKGAATIRHLTTHSSGLSFDSGSARTVDPNDPNYRTEIVERICEFPCTYCPPGTAFFYTDGAMVVAGALVEKVTGKRLDDYVQDEIFVPIGMNDTLFTPLEHGIDRKRIAATGIRDNQIIWGVVHDPTAYRMGGVSGNAGLFSTVKDLSRFCQMILTKGIVQNSNGPKRVFDSNIVEEWTRIQLDVPTGKRAIGWDVDTSYSEIRGDFSLGSFGHTGYTGTSIWIDPEHDVFVVLLTNRVHPTESSAEAIKELRTKVNSLVAARLIKPSPGEVSAHATLFVDVATSPLTNLAQPRSANATDYDNDGDLDIYLNASAGKSVLYRNDAHGKWTEVSAGTALANLGANGRGAAWGDLDGDGDLDVV